MPAPLKAPWPSVQVLSLLLEAPAPLPNTVLTPRCVPTSPPPLPPHSALGLVAWEKKKSWRLSRVSIPCGFSVADKRSVSRAQAVSRLMAAARFRMPLAAQTARTAKSHLWHGMPPPLSAASRAVATSASWPERPAAAMARRRSASPWHRPPLHLLRPGCAQHSLSNLRRFGWGAAVQAASYHSVYLAVQ